MLISGSFAVKDKEAGDGSESSSESDSSDDDETAFNPKFDEEFFKTLSSLKRKDPSIYDQSTKFFDEEAIGEEGGDEPKKKEKKLTIKQYEQNLLLNTGGTFADESDDDNEKSSKRPASPTYNEEQNLIKSEILGKIGNINESSDEDDDIGGLFSKRQKTEKEEVSIFEMKKT